ncbi:ABC transporter substrate-binding protein [Longimicrobium sp.]|jgi:peptide/nickel transport system substrate-binding protein|uniref:ABC transporter substrate-binding protein n=1 Tax=Longimicrobium sp. TaxID=2029185 RepID=UPI002F944192
MMKTARDRARRGAWAVATLALLAACGDRGGADGAAKGDTAAAGAPRRGGTAVIAEIGDLSRPMPLFFSGAPDGDMMDVMYMALTSQSWENGQAVYRLSDESPMALAWHYEYTGPDSTAMRFRLRSALKWSDGQPITAHDVVWTYQAAADPETASPQSYMTEQIDSVKAENDSTVVIHFKRRYPGMMFDAALNVAPRHVYASTPHDKLGTHPVFSDLTKMVVSGAWMVGTHQRGQAVTLVPNPHFPVRPRLDRIVMRMIPDPQTRIVELLNGTVDFARGIPFDQAPVLQQRQPGLTFGREARRYWEFVAWNAKTVEQFAEPEIRRALGMAIDVSGIMQQLRMGDYAERAAGPYSPIFRDLHDPALRPLAHDPEGARRILDAQGWRDTDNDGIRDKNGKPFRFTLMTNTGNQRRQDVVTILQRQWKEVGIDARIQMYELTTFFNHLTQKRDFQAALGSWGVALDADLTAMWTPEGPYNVIGYGNPEVTAMIERARGQPTAAQANPLWRAAAARIVQDQPYTWLYYYDNTTGISPRLKGTHVTSYGAYARTWEWWVNGGPQRGPAPDSAKGGSR